MLTITPSVARNLYEKAPIPIAYLALDGSFISVNPAWTTFAGYSEADLVGVLRIHQISHPQDVEANAKMSQKIIVSKTVKSYVSLSRYLSKDGKAVWGHNFMSAVEDDEGNTTHLLMFIIPLPNHGKYKITTPDPVNVTVRSSLTLWELIVDNKKWIAALVISGTAIFIKIIFILADVLHRVGIDWKEVLF